MSDVLSVVPSYVYDIVGGIFFIVSLYFFWTKQKRAWHWSNATLAPYFFLFVATEMWMLAGLQVIYLLFGAHGWILWKLQEIGHNLAKSWEGLAAPFGGFIFLYTVYVTEFSDVWAWLQFLIVSIAIVGSVLLVLKMRHAWTVYILSNLIGLVYYPHSGLWVLTFVQVCAIVMSVHGYRQWKKDEEYIGVPANV